MSLLNDLDKKQFDKKVARVKELEEERLEKDAEIRIHCNLMPDQRIDRTDFIPYNSGVSNIEELEIEEGQSEGHIISPHTSKRMKVSAYRTTNEEPLDLAVIGGEDKNIAGVMDWIPYGQSGVGSRTNNSIIQMILVAGIAFLVAWIYLILEMDMRGTGNLLDSKMFLISATATFCFSVTAFFFQHSRNTDNFLSGQFICVGHSEGNKIHYVIPISNTNYMEYLTAWFGNIDDRIHSMLKELGHKNLDTIDAQRQEIIELRIKLDEARGSGHEKTADTLERYSVEYKHIERQHAGRVRAAMIGCSALSVILTALIMYLWLGA